MKIALMPNINKQNVPLIIPEICAKLNILGAKVHMSNLLYKDYSNLDIIFVPDDELISNSDIVIAIGGDGTIIHSLKKAALSNKPVLGINAGRLGFMAGLEVFELDKLSALMQRKYTLEKRLMLSVLLKRKDGTTQQFYSLNDAVISHGNISKIIDLKVFYKDKEILEYRADGLIVSTPTGSTAYSLSAGGPVISPDIFCFLITPICPHSLNSRTILFEGNSTIHIMPSGEREQNIYLTIDGEQSIQLDLSDKITISVADTYANLIRIKDIDFFQNLNDKIIDRRS